MAVLKEKTVKNRTKLAQLVRLKEGYARSFDGTRIHYRSVGQGLPIICCNGFGVPSFFWENVERFFKHHHQVVVWDYRGHGQSETPKKLKNATVDALVEDCKAVMDALNIKKAILIGYSLGVQVIFEFYKQYPEHVGAMVPALGTYGRPMDTFYNSSLSKYLYEAFTWVGTFFPKRATGSVGSFLKIHSGTKSAVF